MNKIQLKPQIGGVYFFAAIIISTFMVGGIFYANPVLAQVGIQTSKEEKNPELVSNQLLIKIKSSARSKIKEGNASNSGIVALAKLNKTISVKNIARTAKPGKNSKLSSDVFGWYTITLNDPREIISAKFDANTDTFTFSEENKTNASLKKLQKAMDELRKDPFVEAVEPNYIFTINVVPNDPYYSSMGNIGIGATTPDLWGMHKINAANAWDISIGSTSIIVADIDTGVDRAHEDIADNIWVNTAEVQGNGIDDDANGYIDDSYGWDWANNDNDPQDDHGHGTHTVGTIAGVGNNNLGVVGLNWNSRVMSLKFLNAQGSGDLANGIKALQYAADMGAKVSSNSWGCGCNTQSMDDAIKYEHERGMVVVVAAGNDNSDALSFSPASADHAITVAASDWNDTKASFSNWGSKIDISAPGARILSTKATNGTMCGAGVTLGSKYCYVSGTSMATPHVAGLSALLLSQNPSLTNEQIRQILRISSADLGAAGRDNSFGYGRINAQASMLASGDGVLTPFIQNLRSRTSLSSGLVEITGGIGGQNFASYKLEYGLGSYPSVWTLINGSSNQILNGVLGIFDTTVLSDGKYTIKLTAYDSSGKSYEFQIYDVNVDFFEADIIWPRTLQAPSLLEIKGTATTKAGLQFGGYNLEWSSDGVNWSTSGITLQNGGAQPVSSGILGSWDATSLPLNRIYKLRLTVNSMGGGSSYHTAEILIDPDIVPGWPKPVKKGLACSSWKCEVSPQFIDLNGDGVKEIISTSGGDNKIYAWNKDGSIVSGFPIVVSDAGADENFDDPLTIADIDGNGTPEIMGAAMTPSYLPCGNCNRLYIFTNNGAPYPGWSPKTLISHASLPVAADIDRNGSNEIVIVDSYYQRLHAYRADGSEPFGFPIVLTTPPDGYGRTPGIFDLDNDGWMEIVDTYRNYLYIYNSNGTLRSTYIAPLFPDGSGSLSMPSAGDLDGDGYQEVVVLQDGNGDYGKIFVLSRDGSLLSGWPKDTGHYSGSGIFKPSIADLNKDGKDEVVLGLFNSMIFDISGLKYKNVNIYAENSPALADADGDGKFEYSSADTNAVAIFNDDATTYWSRYLPSDPGRPGDAAGRRFTSPTVFSDMDNDGVMEMAVGEEKSFFNYDPLLYLWKVPKASSGPAEFEWPTFGHDASRSGRLMVGEVPTTTPPQTVILSVSPLTLNFSVGSSATSVPSQDVVISNTGGGFLNWSASLNRDWCHASPLSGSLAGGGSSNMVVSLDGPSNVGTFDCAIIVSDPSASSSPQTISITYDVYDNTSPSTPTGPIATAVSDSAINLSWSVSADNVGVSGYRVYRCQGQSCDPVIQVATTTSNLFADQLLQSFTSYTYKVDAFDSAMNFSSLSSSATATTLSSQDSEVPQVSITSPPNNSQIAKKSTVLITANATDNIGVQKVEFYVSGALTCTDSIAPYSCSWKVPGVTNKKYQLTAKAYDAVGNVGNSTVINVTAK